MIYNKELDKWQSSFIFDKTNNAYYEIKDIHYEVVNANTGINMAKDIVDGKKTLTDVFGTDLYPRYKATKYDIVRISKAKYKYRKTKEAISNWFDDNGDVATSAALYTLYVGGAVLWMVGLVKTIKNAQPKPGDTVFAYDDFGNVVGKAQLGNDCEVDMDTFEQNQNYKGDINFDL